MADIIEHKHLIVRAETEFAPTEAELRQWMTELVEKMEMKILAGPISGDIDYMEGNNGPTCAVIIETSHMACHVWNDTDPNLIQLDVYTCGKMYPERIIEHLSQWNIVTYDMKLFDREYNLEELDV